MNTVTYIALLRAISHMKMQRLIDPFEAMGFTNVETFLASGNVIFDTTPEKTSVLEGDIKDRLTVTLGKETPAYVRTANELGTIAETRPFDGEGDEENNNMFTAFLKEVPTQAALKELQAKRTDVDEFYVKNRVFYWLCRTTERESVFSGSVLEKTLGQKVTMRNVRTVRRIVDKYLKM